MLGKKADFFDCVEVLANRLRKRCAPIPLIRQPRSYVNPNATMPHALVHKSLGVCDVCYKSRCKVKNDIQMRVLS